MTRIFMDNLGLNHRKLGPKRHCNNNEKKCNFKMAPLASKKVDGDFVLGCVPFPDNTRVFHLGWGRVFLGADNTLLTSEKPKESFVSFPISHFPLVPKLNMAPVLRSQPHIFLSCFSFFADAGWSEVLSFLRGFLSVENSDKESHSERHGCLERPFLSQCKYQRFRRQA